MISAGPLAKKLKLKENQQVLLINAPKEYSNILKGEITLQLTQDIQLKSDSVHLFAKNKDELNHWAKKMLPKLSLGQTLWVAFPKKTSKIQTDLTRDAGWEDFIKLANWQVLTLISIDDTWSAIAYRLLGK